ncbi:hypothetical protein H9P43_008101 [Blastocladiella emersonii ATCC 22665]|nr:hypothetical protein H9P43_008101 [Blastocladiella emersonii ATCC 22665]
MKTSPAAAAPERPPPVPRLDVAAYAKQLLGATSYAEREALRLKHVGHENALRQLFAQHRDSAPELADPHVLLVPLHELPPAARCVPTVFADERKLPSVFPNKDKLGEGKIAIADRSEFALNWKLYTAGALDCLDWNNLFAAGGAVQACLSHLDPKLTYGERRDHFLDKFPSSDVDLFIYGLDEDAAKEKMEQIYNSIMDAIPFEVVVIRTPLACTIVSQYPYRHVQIVLRLYKSPAEVIMGFDVDACSVGFDGTRILATPRGHLALLTQTNSIDLTRRSLTYESRLAKYAARGFEVRVPSLRRDDVDPQIYERSFDKVRGLARLLLFEAIGSQENRFVYKEQQRERKGRPEHPNAGQFEARAHLRRSDLKAKDALATSDYATVHLPYGPGYDAARIVRQLAKRDRQLCNDYVMRKRGVKVHTHPTFFGTMQEVLVDACGECPPAGPEDAADLEGFVHGPLRFITDDPGRQSIGSFHPITDEEWTADAYITAEREPLITAVARGDVPAARAILDAQGADYDLESRDWVGRTPLHVAILCARTAMVEFLIERGARVSAPLPDGRLPIHVAAEYGLADIAELVWARNLKNRAELEAQGKAVGDHDEDDDAKKEGKAGSASGSDEDGSDPDGSDADGSDADGSDDGDDDDDDEEENKDESMDEDGEPRPKKDKKKKKVEPAPKEKAEEEEPDVFGIQTRCWDYGLAPIHSAVLYGHLDLVRWLLDHGASPNRKYKMAARWSRNENATLALAHLTPDPAVGMAIAELLLERGAEVDQAVLQATINDQAKDFFVRYVKHSDDALKQLDDLVLAVIRTKDAALLREVIALGATVKFDAAWAAKKFGILLGQAEGRLEMMSLTAPLIEAIGRYDTPNPEIVQILLEAGADVNVRQYRWGGSDLMDEVCDMVVEAGNSLGYYLTAPTGEEPDRKANEERTRALKTLALYDDYVRERRSPVSTKPRSTVRVSVADSAKLQNESLVQCHEKLVALRKIYDMLHKAGARPSSTPNPLHAMPTVEEALTLAIEPLGPALLALPTPQALALERVKKHSAAAAAAEAGTDTSRLDAVKAARELRREAKYTLLTTRPGKATVIPDAEHKEYHALFELVWKGDAARVEQHARDKRVLVTCANEWGESPLAIAIVRQHTAVIGALIKLAREQYQAEVKPAAGKPKVKLLNNYDLDSDKGSDDDSGDSDDGGHGDDLDEAEESDEDGEAEEARRAAKHVRLTHSLTDVKEFLTRNYAFPCIAEDARSYVHPLEHMVLTGWVDGLRALVAAIHEAAAAGDLKYGWESLKQSGIEFVAGDLAQDLVSGHVGDSLTDAARFTSSASPMVLALQLGDINVVRALVQETLGGFQMCIFHHVDGRLAEVKSRMQFKSEYGGLSAAKRYMGRPGGHHGGARFTPRAKKVEFDPEISYWAFFAAAAKEPRTLEYLASQHARDDIDAFVAKYAPRGDARAVELQDAAVRDRFKQHALLLTGDSRGAGKSTILHYLVEATATAPMLDTLAALIPRDQYKALVNQRDANGTTPLYAAVAVHPSRRAVGKLLQQGADPLAVCGGTRQWTALHRACYQTGTKAGVLARPFINHCSLATMVKLLSAKSSVYGHTPLALAMLHGNSGMVRDLVEYVQMHAAAIRAIDADFSVVVADVAANSPVHHAVVQSNVEVLHTLALLAPPASHAAWTAENADGMTPAAHAMHQLRHALAENKSAEIAASIRSPTTRVDRYLDLADETDDDDDEDEVEGGEEAKPTPEHQKPHKHDALRNDAVQTYLAIKAHGLLRRDRLGDRALAPLTAARGVARMVAGVVRDGKLDEHAKLREHAAEPYRTTATPRVEVLGAVKVGKMLRAKKAAAKKA